MPPFLGRYTRALPETISCFRASCTGTRTAVASISCMDARSIRASASSTAPLASFPAILSISKSSIVRRKKGELGGNRVISSLLARLLIPLAPTDW